MRRRDRRDAQPRAAAGRKRRLDRRARARRAGATPPRCLFIGGDFPRKGGFDLLEAWTARPVCRTRRPRPHDELAAADSRCRPPSACSRRHCRTATVAEALARRRSLRLPTRNEAFGIVYQEAAAAGLPAIGSRLNAVPETHSPTARPACSWLPAVTPNWRAALDGLIASAETRRDMGVRAAPGHRSAPIRIATAATCGRDQAAGAGTVSANAVREAYGEQRG